MDHTVEQPVNSNDVQLNQSTVTVEVPVTTPQTNPPTDQPEEIKPLQATTEPNILATNEANLTDQPQIASDNIVNPETIQELEKVKCEVEGCSQLIFKDEGMQHNKQYHPEVLPECLACKPEPGKTIATTEDGKCVVCLLIPGEKKEEVLQGEIVESKPKHPGGRPTKYNGEMLKVAKDYYDYCRGIKDGKKRMPFMEELALNCGVNDDTLYEWMSLNEEFSETIKALKNLQKLRIIQSGFSAKNPTFQIFMLKVNHGMVETEKKILAGENRTSPIYFETTNYGDKKQLDSTVAQAVLDEGTK